MSYSIDANILLYASDESSEWHQPAKAFLKQRATDPDILCLTWLVLMAYQRIATHPAIFTKPLTPELAWGNVQKLLALPRTRVVAEAEEFAEDYRLATAEMTVSGNLVPDAHVATILREHGVRRIYTADTDFRKFHFLEAINPLRAKR
jgi:toxin-antitoxin system PIN domain toxin